MSKQTSKIEYLYNQYKEASIIIKNKAEENEILKQIIEDLKNTMCQKEKIIDNFQQQFDEAMLKYKKDSETMDNLNAE